MAEGAIVSGKSFDMLGDKDGEIHTTIAKMQGVYEGHTIRVEEVRDCKNDKVNTKIWVNDKLFQDADVCMNSALLRAYILIAT